MSNILPIKQILSMPDGAIVSGVAGLITNIYQRRTGNGTSDGKEYSYQTIKIKDAAGTQLSITLKNRPEFPQANSGKTVTIEASDKYTKVKVDPEYGAQLMVGKAAKITVGGAPAGGGSASSGNGGGYQRAVMPQLPPNRIKMCAMQLANIYAYARKSAEVALNDPMVSPKGASEESIQACASSVYITLTRDVDRVLPLLEKMPVLPMSKVPGAPPQPDPEPEPEPEPQPEPQPEPPPAPTQGAPNEDDVPF